MRVGMVLSLILVAGTGEVRAQQLLTPATLRDRAADTSLPGAERDFALAALERVDLETAIEISELLIGDRDLTLRARAAWILASTNHDDGRRVLRNMAQSDAPESVMAVECLGRLRDGEGHGILTRLLRDELASTRSPWRVSSLVQSLGDYGNPHDGPLMGAAIEGFYHPADWVLVDAVGRTGGVPIIVAKDIFRNAGGWTEMAAGLALARAGDADGVGYVNRLLDMTTSSPNASDDRMSSAERDDPNGLRARDFLLERLGAEVDERFVPELLRMIDRAPAGSPLRAQAWRALLRMNPVGSRSQILGRAWKQEGNESAFRFIALHDPDAAKAFLSRSKSDDARTRSLRRALGASERERRVWRELRGYTF